jgi:hypothetical protein
MAMALANGGTMTAVSLVAMAAGAGAGVAAQGLLELLKQLGVLAFRDGNGTRGGNQNQNRDFRRAIDRGARNVYDCYSVPRRDWLNAGEIQEIGQELHLDITGNGLGFHQIVELAEEAIRLRLGLSGPCR